MRKHLTYANAMATLAFLIAVAGGTAYAANTIGSSDVIDESLLSRDVKNGQVKTADIGNGEVRSADVADGNLTGADVAANSLKGSDIDESTLDIGHSARAYARVTYVCSGADATCSFDRSKGISSVEKVGAGQYCVQAPGIDPHQTPAVVSVDWNTTVAPQGNASALAASDVLCDGGGFGVLTYSGANIAVTDTGGNARTVRGASTLSDQVAFTIVIP